jgi:hypothetical protein
MQATRVSLFRAVASTFHAPLVDKQSVTLLLQTLNKSLHGRLSRQAIKSNSALENHFEYILLNPLIAFTPTVESTGPPAQVAFTQLQAGLAKGTFNQQALTQCLYHLARSPVTRAAAQLPAKLFRLLQSSSFASVSQIDRPSQIQLMKLLVRENEHDIAYHWIQNSLSTVPLPHYLQACIAEQNVTFAIKAAMALVPQMTQQAIGGLMVIAVHLLGHVPDSAEIPEELYQQLIRQSNRIADSYSSSRTHFTHATLALLNPDPSLANSEVAQQYFESPDGIESTNAHGRLNQLQLALRLAESLLAKSDYTKAAWILDFAKLNFPNELGISNKSQTDSNTSRSTAKKESSPQKHADVLSRLDGLLST